MTVETIEYSLIEAPKDCDVISLSDDSNLLFEKEHAYVGKFRMKTPKGPVDFELTDHAIEVIASESQRYIDNGNPCNLPTKHTDDTEANRGLNLKWFTKEDSKGRLGLFSRVEFRDKEAAKLARTAQTSIYIPPASEDGIKNKYVRAIKHVALTGSPTIPGLDGFTPIAASLVIETETNKKEIIMPIKELAASIGLQLSDEILSDETKAYEAITESFKDLKEDSGKQVKNITLELSEYKKLHPPIQDPVKISKSQVKMLKENRELKLSNLVEKGNILTCVKNVLEKIFCGEATLTLSLAEDVEDNFDGVVDALRDNDPIKLSEATGPQGGDVGTLLDKETNPVIANAMKQKEKIEAKMVAAR